MEFRNLHHDYWKKFPRTSLVYSEKFPWTETPITTNERNSPGQVWSTARNSPGQKPLPQQMKEISPDKSGLWWEIFLDRNPPHNQWKKFSRTSLQQEIPPDYSENPPPAMKKVSYSKKVPGLQQESSHQPMKKVSCIPIFICKKSP